MTKKRAIIIVIDSMGIGAMPDCAEFNDVPECNTLANICKYNKGLKLPNMARLGLGNIQEFEGVERTANPTIRHSARKIQRKRHYNRTLGNRRACFGKTVCDIPARISSKTR